MPTPSGQVKLVTMVLGGLRHSSSTTALEATDVGLSNQPIMWGVTVDPKATFLTRNWTLGHGHTHLSSQAIDKLDRDKLAKK